MDSESKIILRKVIIDVVCLACVGFPVLGFYLFGVPYQRGFFCNDESLRYPFLESTVTSAMLYFIGLVIPICVFAAVEWIHFRISERQVSRKFMGYSLHPWLWRCYCVIGVFGFGAASSQLLTDIAKYSIGRLRPHFWDVCKPDIDCSKTENQNVYITPDKFNCTGDNPKRIREVRLSFLSGHSSFSAYTMVFLVLYLQCRVHWKGSHLFRHVVQFICIAMAWGTALSRVSNYKHHWSDVLAGSLLGTAVAVVVVRFVSSLWIDDSRTYKRTATSDPTQGNGVNLSVTENILSHNP